MKKNIRFVCLDFYKNLRDSATNDTERRRYAVYVDLILNNINLIDYLIYKKES